MRDNRTADAVLLEAWRGGDPCAGRALLARHLRSLRRFFDARVDPADADDLAQETLAAIVANRDRIRAASFRAYVHSVARHAWMMRTRSSLRAERRLEQLVGLQPPALSPEAELGRAQQLDQLVECWHRLPASYRAALGLHYGDGLSIDEIATRLGTSASAIKARLHRAREWLRRQVHEVATR